MLKVENCVTPSPEMWQAVIQGMRLPMKSQAKYDSGICYDSEELDPLCYICPKIDRWEDEYTPVCKYVTYDDGPLFVLGEEDKRLALGLCKAGDPSHRKFLRQLPLILTVKAPLYWWKQADQYKISTTTNSESTMHTLVKYPFKPEDFSIKDLKNIGSLTLTFDDQDPNKPTQIVKVDLQGFIENGFIGMLNSIRDVYLITKDDKYWHIINELLPQSYNQTRCWSINYETALNIINQRRGHKNKEWDVLIDYLLENVPYLKEFYEAVND